MPFDRQGAIAAGYTPEEVDAYEASLQPRQPDAPASAGLQEIPEFLGATQAIRGGAQLLGRMASRAGNAIYPGQPFNAGQSDVMAQRFPGATQVGEGVAMAALPTPGGPLARIAAGGLYGALSGQDPVAGAVGGLAGAGLGEVTGQIAGRVLNGITQAARGIFRPKPRLPSGVLQTAGQASGDKTVQALEAGLARNPVTARPFAKIAADNEALHQGTLATALGASPGTPITEDLVDTFLRDSIAKINQAVPDAAQIPIPDPIRGELGRANKKLAGVMADFPTSGVLSGKNFRALRSTLGAMSASPEPINREWARLMIGKLDDAAAASGQIDQALFGEGRQGYRIWQAVTGGKSLVPTGNAGELRINVDTLANNLERTFGKPSQYGRTTGIPAIDDLIATTNDMKRAKSIVPNSGTPTGMAPAAVIADIATTGGLGTLSAMGASELMGTGAGAGLAQGLMKNPKALPKALNKAGRVAAQQLTRDELAAK